jgi:hypothetical protein
LQEDGWIFGRKRRGDGSEMKFENLKGIPEITFLARTSYSKVIF